MMKKRFHQEFPDESLNDAPNMFGCDHCVNKWGIDLCGCGSGETPEKCDGGFNECGSPMQTLGEIQNMLPRF